MNGTYTKPYMIWNDESGVWHISRKDGRLDELTGKVADVLSAQQKLFWASKASEVHSLKASEL